PDATADESWRSRRDATRVERAAELDGDLRQSLRDRGSQAARVSAGILSRPPGTSLPAPRPPRPRRSGTRVPRGTRRRPGSDAAAGTHEPARDRGPDPLFQDHASRIDCGVRACDAVEQAAVSATAADLVDGAQRLWIIPGLVLRHLRSERDC